MLGSLAPARRRLVLGVVVAVTLLVAVVVAVTVRNAQDDVTPVPQDELGPVLLVPGYGGTVSALEPLRARLESDGRVTVVVPAPGNGTGDLDEQAENLGRAAEQAMQDNDAASVDVVGYSAGGVVARLWVRDHGGASLARRVLSIGSPHHGSDVAELVLGAAGDCPPACRQLIPDSALLRGLNARDETPAGPAFISAWSSSDQVSTPPETARLDGALNVPVQSICPRKAVSHGQLPADPAVLALLGSALGEGAPKAPTNVTC